MRVLTFSSLYPNAAQPGHGVFVENRMRRVAHLPGVALSIVAPVPWFPFTSKRFGQYGAFARAPRGEVRHGLVVDHPRYPVIPKVGMTLAPALMAWALRPALARHIAAHGRPDVIDAHYVYPDGVAAVRLGREMGIPVVITARGTDINLIPAHPKARAQILEATDGAAALIAVCQALKDEWVALGAPADKITVLRNGVDLDTFRPMDRDVARADFGVAGKVAVSVGLLIKRKGHHLTIDAMRQCPDVTLLIAGEGPERSNLERQIRGAGLGGRVRLLGRVGHDRLAALYSAADLSVLASSREGWANVLLESMACGTPVAATSVWGTPEVVATPEAGVLVERTSDSIADGIRRLLTAPPDGAATRAYAERFSWDATTAGVLALFRRVVAER